MATTGGGNKDRVRRPKGGGKNTMYRQGNYKAPKKPRSSSKPVGSSASGTRSKASSTTTPTPVIAATEKPRARASFKKGGAVKKNKK